MKYRVEVIEFFYRTTEPARWRFHIEYTDDRNAPSTKAGWLNMFHSFYGLVVDTVTGAIEYSIGATNPDWIKWALAEYFKTLPAD